MRKPGGVVDDFTGPKKKAPDPALWGYDTGGAWPNDELENYTESVNNASTDGDGHLVITAIKTSVGYSSARLNTQGKSEMGYGRVEASIQMPPGPNVLPAFWLLGSSGAQCGEIDIIEYLFSQCYFTLHGPQDGEPDYRPPGLPPYSGVSRVWSPPFDPTTGFHTYWVERHPGEVTIGVDDAISYTFTPESLPANAHWVFDNQPMFAIMNLAVGGGWAGAPDGIAKFPQQMLVDWFRYTPSAN
jgi:beta-glucanase (GH16 family)